MGVSVLEVLRGGPKVYDGQSKVFLEPTGIKFQFSWPGYQPVCLRTSLDANVCRLHLAEYICKAIVDWLDAQKKSNASPQPGYEQWDVRRSCFHPSNLWLWALRKIQGYDGVYIIDVYVEP